MSANEKKKATIEVLKALEVQAKVAGRAKNPVLRLVAAELEVELKERRERLEASLTEPDLPMGNGEEN